MAMQGLLNNAKARRPSPMHCANTTTQASNLHAFAHTDVRILIGFMNRYGLRNL